MSKKILLIEDEVTINDVLKEYLEDSGYTCIQSYDGLDGLMKFNPDFSLIICDVMMPKLDGYAVVEEVRKKSDIPVIMLTALSNEEDVLKGYELGVDEYVSKPFSPKIIVKKVEAILSRHKQSKTKETLEKGRITISFTSRTVAVNNEIIKVSKKEFDLLELFILNEGIVYTRDTLLNHIWGYDYFGDDRVVDTAIKRLRKKLKEASSYIKTEHGVGYKFEVML